MIRPRPRYSGAMFRDIARPIFTTAAAVLRSNACSVPINTIITSTRRCFVKRSIPAPPRRRYRREIIFVSEDTYGGGGGTFIARMFTTSGSGRLFCRSKRCSSSSNETDYVRLNGRLCRKRDKCRHGCYEIRDTVRRPFFRQVSPYTRSIRA